MITLDEIASYKYTDSKVHKKALDYIIHDEHMYVLDRFDKNPKYKKRTLQSINELYKTSYIKYIITDEDKYKEILDEIKQKNILNDYNNVHFWYKTNLVTYIDKKDYTSQTNKASIYTAIETTLKLRGTMNMATYDCIYECNKVRYIKSGKKNTIQFDENKAYVSQLYKKKIIFPIPTINDYFKKYRGTSVSDWGIYYCELNFSDDILGKGDDYYSGYEVRILKKNKQIKKIISELVCDRTQKIEIENIKYDYDQLRRYIGWLIKSVNIGTSTYDNIKGEEADAICDRYENSFHDKEKNTLTISKNHLVTKTGILANFIIKSLTNIDIYNFNIEFKKLNPTCKFNSAHTDSIGYILKTKDVVLPKKLIGEKIGQFKDESHKIYKGKNTGKHDSFKSPKAPILIPEKKLIEHDNIEKLLSSKSNFFLRATGGYGKSYLTKNTIIPYLEKHNLKYILTSTTIENASDIDGETVQSQFSKKSIEEIDILFADKTYLIIDEMSQMDQHLFKYLEYIKTYTKCSLILIGDIHQCKSIDAFKKTWLVSEFVNDLIDYNIYEIKVHDKIRYSKELNEVIMFMKDNFENQSKVFNYVLKTFKITKEITTAKNIAYYNYVVDKLNKINIECYTVHKVQGKTIKEDFTIHNIRQMPMDVLFTAITRATTIDQIHIKL